MKKNPKTIGYIGRITEEKGILVFLEALKELNNDGKLKNWEVKIAGTGVLNSYVKKLVNKYALSGKVEFVGFVNNYQFIEKLQFLVNPMLNDSALEMVNVEAAYCGVPVITFGNEEIPETVIDGKTGIKVKTKTSQALAQAIADLITNPEEIERMGTYGPTFAAKNYNFSSQVEKLRKVYRKLNLI